MSKKNPMSVYRIVSDPKMTINQKQAALDKLPDEPGQSVSQPYGHPHRGADFLFPGRKAYFDRGDAAQAAARTAPQPATGANGRYPGKVGPPVESPDVAAGRYPGRVGVNTFPIVSGPELAGGTAPATMYQPTEDRTAATPLVFSSEDGGHFRTPDEQMQYVESVKNRPEPTPLYFDEGDNSFKEFGDEQPSDNRLARAAGGSQ